MRVKRKTKVAASKNGMEPVEEAESDEGVRAVEGPFLGGVGGPSGSVLPPRLATREAAVSRRACSSSSSHVRFVSEAVLPSCDAPNGRTLPKSDHLFLNDMVPSGLPASDALSLFPVGGARKANAGSELGNALENESNPSRTECCGG